MREATMSDTSEHVFVYDWRFRLLFWLSLVLAAGLAVHLWVVSPSPAFFFRPHERLPVGLVLYTLPVFAITVGVCYLAACCAREYGVRYRIVTDGLERIGRGGKSFLITWANLTPRYANGISWWAGRHAGTVEAGFLDEPALFLSRVAEHVLRARGAFHKVTTAEWLGPPRWPGSREVMARIPAFFAIAGVGGALGAATLPVIPRVGAVVLGGIALGLALLAGLHTARRNLMLRVIDEGVEIRGCWPARSNAMFTWSQLAARAPDARLPLCPHTFPDPDQLWAYYYLVYGGWHKHR